MNRVWVTAQKYPEEKESQKARVCLVTKFVPLALLGGITLWGPRSLLSVLKGGWCFSNAKQLDLTLNGERFVMLRLTQSEKVKLGLESIFRFSLSFSEIYHPH